MPAEYRKALDQQPESVTLMQARMVPGLFFPAGVCIPCVLGRSIWGLDWDCTGHRRTTNERS